MNKLLTRQIKRHFGSFENVPDELKSILNDINNTYDGFDDDTQLLQNSIEISSQELRNAYQKHIQDTETQKETITKIKEAIYVIKPASKAGMSEVGSSASESSYMIDSLINLIEEHKKSVDELKESEARFRLMSDSAPVLIWMSGTDGLCDFFNQTWLDFTGRTLNQELGNGWAEGVHPDDLPGCLDTYMESFKERRNFRMEYRLKRADGEYRWVLDNGVPRFTPQGIFTGYIGTCVDITENKHVEETLRNLSKAVEQSPISIVITDIDGNIEYGNPVVFKLTGYEKEELLGKSTNIFKSGETSQQEYKLLWETISSGNEWKGEFHNRKKNGELFWELATISAVKNQNGEIVNYLAVKEDITESKQMTVALRESEKKYREVVENVKEIIFQTDVEGLWIFLNIAWEEITGFSVKESIGQLFVNYVHPDDRQRNMELFEPLIQRKKDYCRHQIRYLTKDGGFRWIEVFARLGLNERDEITGTYGTLQDITKRKQDDETLQNERNLFRTIIDLIPDAVYVKDTHGRKIIANPKEVQLAGLNSEDEIIGKVDSDFYPVEQANRSAKEDQLVIQSGVPILNTEGTLVDKYGKLHSLLVSKVPLYDVQGKITGLVGVTHDFTERKQAEDELHAAHKSLSDILNAALHTSIIATDKKGIITVFSKGAEKLLGYSADELIGKKTPNCFHKESEVVERGLELSQELRRPIKGFDVFTAKAQIKEHEERTWTYIHKSGSTILVNLIVTAIRNANGEVTGFLGIASDITDRKKAENQVKHVSKRLELATLAGGVGVWDYNIVKNALLWDDQMFALYGVNRNDFEVTYKTWISKIHPDDAEHIDSDIQLAISGEKEFDTEFRVRWNDGTIHNIRALARVQHDDYSKPISMIGTNWDITEQKKNESVLLKARQDAEMANKSKSVFLANMSHEIRTPLNAIIGFSQLMNRDKLLTDSQKEYIHSIISAGEHLLSLINDILELSKMEAGRLEVNSSNVDLHALISDIQLIFKEPVQSKHIQFIFETAIDIPQYVIVDDNKLRRIFINLIGNAVKFTDEGGIAVRARVDKIDENKSMLIVDVQDSGPGIPENELGKLFKYFVQTGTGISKSSGSGLGLALSRELAILMGGDITVISEVGKGSVFTFQVEIQKGKAEDVSNLSKKRIVSFEKGQEVYRILVVDDKEENLKVVVSLLNMVGFETMEAVNGEDAIAKFEQWNPHLILMDMRMPVMDGYEATHRIKSMKKGRNTPIIALTASSFEDERRKTVELGMQGHIRKPFREVELFGTIGNVLGIKFIYQDELPVDQENYQSDNEAINSDVAKLPLRLVKQLQDAIAVADLDLLIELIRTIDSGSSKLSQHLLDRAKNFDYDYLQKILGTKKQ